MTDAVKLAESFLYYCRRNPTQRFWQALLNWSGMPFIFISYRPIYAAKEPDNTLLDPYHWKGKTE